MNILSKTCLTVGFLVVAAPLVRADSTSRPIANKGCPTVIENAIDKAFPKAVISTCKTEKDQGHDQFVVMLTKTDGDKAEVDVLPDGKIVMVEQKITIDKVPGVVMKAFRAKYPKASADSAEKQTPGQGKVTYEIAFRDAAKSKAATFNVDGVFVEEE